MKENIRFVSAKDRRHQANLKIAQGRVHGTVYLEGKPRTNGQVKKEGHKAPLKTL